MDNKKFVITDENVEEYAKKISNWIKKQVEKAKTDGVVLGMSGGVDCSTVARLCQEADVKIHLVILPVGNNMKNSSTFNHAMDLINKFNFDVFSNSFFSEIFLLIDLSNFLFKNLIKN